VNSRAVEGMAELARRPMDAALAALEENPLFVLSEVAMRSVAERDRIIPRMAVVETGKRFLALLEAEWAGAEGQRLLEFVNAFLIVFRGVGQAAIRLRDNATVIAVLRTMSGMHESMARARLPWYCTIEFDEAIQELLLTCIEEGLDSAATEGLWGLEWALESHLEHNVPPEDEIFRFLVMSSGTAEEAADPDKDIQWENVSMHFVGMLSTLGKAAIDSGRPGIAEGVLSTLGRVIHSVGQSKTLGLLQKEEVIRWCHLHSAELVALVAKERGPSGSSLLHPFRGHEMFDQLNEERPWAKSGLLLMRRTLLGLAEKRLLHSWSLNDLGFLGRMCIHHVDEDTRFAEATILVSDTLQRIGGAYRSVQTAEDARMIQETLNQLKSLKVWFSREKKLNAIVESRIQQGIDDVASIAIPDRFVGSELLDWPSVQYTQESPG